MSASGGTARPGLESTDLPELHVRLVSDNLSREWSIPVYFNGSYPLLQMPDLTSDPGNNAWQGVAALEVGHSGQIFAGNDAWTSPHDGSGRLNVSLAGDQLLLFLEVTGSNAAHLPEAPNMARIYLSALNASNPRMSRSSQLDRKSVV